MTIVEFLKARIAEREAEARADSPVNDTDEDEDAPDYYDRYFARVDLHKRQPHGSECAWRVSEGMVESCFCDYPARVLRRCKADRAIVALHHPEPFWDASDGCFCAHDQRTAGIYPCPTIRHLAAVDSDHEDFQEEWLP